MTRKLHGPAGPSRQQMQLVLLGLLVIVAGGVMFFQFGPTDARGGAGGAGHHAATDVSRDTATTDTRRPTRGSAVHAPPRIAHRRALAVTWPVAVSRDPFTWAKLQQPVAQVAAAPREAGPDRDLIEQQARAMLQVQAIMIDATPRAMINNRLLHEGSVIGGFEVSQIQERVVIVASQGVSVRLALQ